MARASMERQVNGAMKGRSIFRDEEGSTTAGMAVALLVTLSLLFSAAQVYRIHAAGAEVQEVADAAACAALNPVAEFMVAVRVADAAQAVLALNGGIEASDVVLVKASHFMRLDRVVEGIVA